MTELTPDLFRRACGFWATGVSIVTTADVDGKPYGLTMNAVTSLSLDPPMFLICVDNKSDTLGPIQRSGVFCINVLQDGQQDLSNRFAKKGGDKFEGVAFERGTTGAPLITGRLMGVECRVTTSCAGGDHQIFLGHVAGLTLPAAESALPMLYYRGRYARLEA